MAIAKPQSPRRDDMDVTGLEEFHDFVASKTRDVPETLKQQVRRFLEDYAAASLRGNLKEKRLITEAVLGDYLRSWEISKDLGRCTVEVGQIKALREFSENVAEAAFAYLTAEDHSDPEPLVRLGEAVELWLHHKNQLGEQP